ncbi:MAG: oxygen-independent coproporphyrinogen oxidase [Pseudomonadota bacterium]
MPFSYESASEVVARFATSAPRYTSYPTAPHFREDADWDAVRGAFAAGDRPLGVYAHVPFCERRCLYCGCHVQIARDRGLGTTYVDDLLAELDVLGGLTDLTRPLEVVALGGGTPTWLARPDLQRLVQGLRERLRPAADAEWSIEIDPRSIEPEEAEFLRGLGFNRVSLGVQDLEPEVLDAIGRPQTAAQVEAVADAFAGMPLNFDLMYGLPLQTERSIRRTVRKAVTLGATRFAVFGYAHVPWMRKHQRGMERHGLPGDQQRLGLMLAAREELLELGYVALGLDHYARPDDRLALAATQGNLGRNFMGYSDRAEVDLLGLGVSAIGGVGETFTANARDLAGWRTAVREGRPSWERGLVRSEDDARRGWVIMRLMCDLRVDKQAYATRFGRDFDADFPDARAAIAEFVDAGLCRDDADAIAVDGEGWLVARNIAATFDRHLGAAGARYSRTV